MRTSVDTSKPWWRRAWLVRVALLGLLMLLAAQLVAWELRTSTLQARYLAAFAKKLSFRVEPGASPAIHFPQAGPFDERLGYDRIGDFAEGLRESGYAIAAQARQSPALLDFTGRGYFAPYHEKTQTGLRVLDCRDTPLFGARYPQRGYADFDAVPPLVLDTLSFIENRELLAVREPKHNPVVELPRLAKAAINRAISVVDPDYPSAGGSTLATQIEKYRHSPEGRTASSPEKLRQMVSASVRAYLDGEETLHTRQRIIADYINSVPLGAFPGYGEVNGIADGLATWYGADFDAVNRLLRRPQADGAALAPQARAYREVLSLMIAQRRPSYYFGSGQEQLGHLTDSYLRLLGEAGVITAALRDAALQARPLVRQEGERARGEDYTTRKAATLVRTQLASLLDTPRLYDLDRLDLRVASSIDAPLQNAVTDLLRRLRDPAAAKAAGLVGPHLLERGDPSKLFYSFTLYEATEDGNRLRVQADNLDQPFDINAGAKLELGSTAKLRTLVSYLEIIAELHQRYVGISPDALRKVEVDRRDHLTRWSIDHLLHSKDKSLAPMLAAAMERRYSASPGEAFFTGGGVHSFENFEREDNHRQPTVSEALQGSINLAFIRLMRDVVYHHMYGEPAAAARILDDPANPQRAVLLARFAEREGNTFIRQFYRKYHGKTPAQMLEMLSASARATPEGQAVVYRTLVPDGDIAGFSEFVHRHAPIKAAKPIAAKAIKATPVALVQPAAAKGKPAKGSAKAPVKKAAPAQKKPAPDPLIALYQRHTPGHYSLADRAYLAHVHPLELWVASHLRENPNASLLALVESSRAARQDGYAWLFQPRMRGAQDTRIASLLEVDAFARIHRSWQRLGYPFEYLVPSYATAIGSSGDRPAALAELMGIIVNDGLRLPTVRIEELQFADATPYATLLRRAPPEAERVLAPEIAATLKRALTQVVAKGTARRVHGALDGPDGSKIAIGGKTGTGDNRIGTYSARGQRIESRVVSRTATFVFFIGARHFGTVTAYVPGVEAEAYRFTSALPVQILKTLAPTLRPLVAASSDSANAVACKRVSPDPNIAHADTTSAAMGHAVALKTPFGLQPTTPRPEVFEPDDDGLEWAVSAERTPVGQR